MNYTLKDNDGNTIDQAQNGDFIYLHGANNIIPGLESALSGKESGANVSVSISPEKGYGVRDEGRKQTVPKSMFPDESQLSVGAQFHAEGPEGEMVMVTVDKIEKDNVVLDGNHPLAGVDLNFDVEIVEVRNATDEELTHGHVHAGGSCDH